MAGKRDRAHIDEQGRAFIEKARELGCDEDEGRFVELVRRVAKARPQQPAGKEPPPPKGASYVSLSEAEKLAQKVFADRRWESTVLTAEQALEAASLYIQQASSQRRKRLPS